MEKNVINCCYEINSVYISTIKIFGDFVPTLVHFCCVPTCVYAFVSFRKTSH